MAEKEERILIKKKINYHPPYGGWRGDGKEIVLTRQEAINRMAKEMCSSGGESCKQCAVKNDKHACESVLHDELFMEYAEAALDALLEG